MARKSSVQVEKKGIRANKDNPFMRKFDNNLKNEIGFKLDKWIKRIEDNPQGRCPHKLPDTAAVGGAYEMKSTLIPLKDKVVEEITVYGQTIKVVFNYYQCKECGEVVKFPVIDGAESKDEYYKEYVDSVATLLSMVDEAMVAECFFRITRKANSIPSGTEFASRLTNSIASFSRAQGVEWIRDFAHKYKLLTEEVSRGTTFEDNMIDTNVFIGSIATESASAQQFAIVNANTQVNAHRDTFAGEGESQQQQQYGNISIKK